MWALKGTFGMVYIQRVLANSLKRKGFQTSDRTIKTPRCYKCYVDIIADMKQYININSSVYTNMSVCIITQGSCWCVCAFVCVCVG